MKAKRLIIQNARFNQFIECSHIDICSFNIFQPVYMLFENTMFNNLVHRLISREYTEIVIHSAKVNTSDFIYGFLQVVCRNTNTKIILNNIT